MQDKTINNALLALRKQIILGNGEGQEHVEALLKLRGVRLRQVLPQHGNVARKGEMARYVLQALSERPMRRQEIVDYIAPLRPDVPRDRLYWRTDGALSKLHRAGRVERSGQIWRLRP